MFLNIIEIASEYFPIYVPFILLKKKIKMLIFLSAVWLKIEKNAFLKIFCRNYQYVLFNSLV